MKKAICLLCLLSFAAAAGLRAQNVPFETGKAVWAQTGLLTSETRQKILATTRRVLNDYALAASLSESKTNRRVTEASIKRFNKLFSNNARVFKDFVEFPPQILISNDAYADGIFNRLEDQGLEFEIENAVLEQVKYDPTGYFQAVLRLKKVVFNYVTDAGIRKREPSGRNFDLRMSIDINAKDLAYGVILSIESAKEVVVAEDYTKFWEGSLGGGLNLWSGSENAAWRGVKFHPKVPNPPAAGEQSLQPTLGFSIGGMFRNSRYVNPAASPNKRLFWAVGARFSWMSVVSKIEDFTNDSIADTANGVDYLRQVGVVSGEQKDRFGLLEIPLGVSLRLLKTEKSNLLVDLLVVPSFPLFAKSEFSGTGKFDGFLPGADFRFLRKPSLPENSAVLGLFHMGDSLALPAENTIEKGPGLALRLSPTYFRDQINDDPAWGFSIGLDLGYVLKAPLKFVEAPKNRFAFPASAGKDAPPSANQFVYSRLSALSFGLRLGVYKRFRTGA